MKKSHRLDRGIQNLYTFCYFLVMCRRVTHYNYTINIIRDNILN